MHTLLVLSVAAGCLFALAAARNIEGREPEIDYSHGNPHDRVEGGGSAYYTHGPCNCQYEYWAGGCRISQAAPHGAYCYCGYSGFFTCTGWSEVCASRDVAELESCQGGCKTKKCCQNSPKQGDCNGYYDNEL